MILWVILFALVVLISFILAIQSMRDFAELPSKDGDYGLFLIRNIGGLNAQVLDSIRSRLLRSGSIISFERLFKGKKSALAVFGGGKLLLNYQDSLNLLELEDYTNVNAEHISAWEAGIKGNGKLNERILAKIPQHFLESEQFWWQITLSGAFNPQITAVVASQDTGKKHSLAHTLQNLAPEQITKLPKAFSNAQLLDFYQKRSFRKDKKNPNLSSEQILQLLLI